MAKKSAALSNGQTLADICEAQATPKLDAYKADLMCREKRLIIVSGLPSTGKTKCAVDAGFLQASCNFYRQLVLCRPILKQATGFLKGTLIEKMGPYVAQANEYILEQSQGNSNVASEMAGGMIQIYPADMLQGIRFRHKFVIIDEAQNISDAEAFKILSRVGENCKLVLLGDMSKGQCEDKLLERNLLSYAISKFQNKDYCGIHTFYDSQADILGDEVTRDIIQTILPDFLTVNMEEIGGKPSGARGY